MARPMPPVSPCAPWLCSGTSTPTGLARAATTRLVALRSTTLMASSITPTGSTTCSSPPPWEGGNYEPRNPMESVVLFCEALCHNLILPSLRSHVCEQVLRVKFRWFCPLLELRKAFLRFAITGARPLNVLRSFSDPSKCFPRIVNHVIEFSITVIHTESEQEVETRMLAKCRHDR